MNKDVRHPDTIESLLEKLQRLLRQQIELVRKGNLKHIDKAIDQADYMVAQIRQLQHTIPDAACQGQASQVLKLYHDLVLMLEVQKELTSRQLKKVIKGKKTVRAYH